MTKKLSVSWFSSKLVSSFSAETHLMSRKNTEICFLSKAVYWRKPGVQKPISFFVIIHGADWAMSRPSQAPKPSQFTRIRIGLYFVDSSKQSWQKNIGYFFLYMPWLLQKHLHLRHVPFRFKSPKRWKSRPLHGTLNQKASWCQKFRDINAEKFSKKEKHILCFKSISNRRCILWPGFLDLLHPFLDFMARSSCSHSRCPKILHVTYIIF
jgi:hypothetical protein